MPFLTVAGSADGETSSAASGDDAKIACVHGRTDDSSADESVPTPSYCDAVAELQRLLEEHWWLKKPVEADVHPARARKRPGQSRAAALRACNSSIATALAQQQHALALASRRSRLQQTPARNDSPPSKPWWEPSERQQRLQQLCAALERGEHYVLNFAEGNSSAPGATASLLVRQLLTSTRHGPLTQAEVLACASVLTNLCASHADEVTAACDGLLERWAIERLDLVHGANTEQAAELELLLLQMLGHACNSPASVEHTKAVPRAERVLRRLLPNEMLGARAGTLLDVLGYDDPAMIHTPGDGG